MKEKPHLMNYLSCWVKRNEILKDVQHAIGAGIVKENCKSI